MVVEGLKRAGSGAKKRGKRGKPRHKAVSTWAAFAARCYVPPTSEGLFEEMAEEDRVKAVQEVSRMTTAQLLEWRVRRTAGDSFRDGVVDWELKSRSNAAAYKAAIAAGVLGAVVGALLTWALGHRWF